VSPGASKSWFLWKICPSSTGSKSTSHNHCAEVLAASSSPGDFTLPMCSIVTPARRLEAGPGGGARSIGSCRPGIPMKCRSCALCRATHVDKRWGPLSEDWLSRRDVTKFVVPISLGGTVFGSVKPGLETPGPEPARAPAPWRVPRGTATRPRHRENRAAQALMPPFRRMNRSKGSESDLYTAAYRMTRLHVLRVRLSALAGSAVHRMRDAKGSSRSVTSNRCERCVRNPACPFSGSPLRFPGTTGCFRHKPFPASRPDRAHTSWLPSTAS
jgi:hypothetical protein